MDRDAVARAGRRAQAEEALADEREREAALRQQVAEVVLEQEGCRVDAEAFAGLDADEVRRVRTALGQLDDETEDDDAWLAELSIELDDEAEPDEPEQELSRLEDEIAESQRTQHALERYLAALDGAATTGEG
ncbi:MAG TPA: hypothetical protein VHH57_01765 [Gaiella sp.]|nr:hypothetical protein [Gaiella sp.]